MPVDQADIEVAINQVRAARAARRALEDPGSLPSRGASVVFPVSVPVPGTGAGRPGHHWSWRSSHEPGSVFPAGVTAVRYGGRIGAVEFRGLFHVVVGDVEGPVPDPVVVTGVANGRGRPSWAVDLPGNLHVPVAGSRRLRAALGRRARTEDEAVTAVMRSARPYLAHLADGFTPQLRHRRGLVEREDLISEGWKRAFQVLAQFAGPDRPSVAWSTALFRNCRRDMHRALHALDGVSEAVVNARAACVGHPEITDPAEMARQIAVDATARRLADAEPGLDPVVCAARAAADPGPCPHTTSAVAAAMALPRLVSWDESSGRSDGVGDGTSGRLGDHLAGVDDAGLLAVEAAAPPVARLLAGAAGLAGGEIEDVLADLGLADAGDPAAARLPSLRRRVLRPFILPGEAPQSEAVLQRAGRRARVKLFVNGDLLPAPHLAAAWRAGVNAEEAARIDRTA